MEEVPVAMLSRIPIGDTISFFTREYGGGKRRRRILYRGPCLGGCGTVRKIDAGINPSPFITKISIVVIIEKIRS